MKFLTQLFILGLQLLYLHLQYCYLLMSIIANKLKVFRVSVVLLIFSRTSRVFGVSMMDYFPSVKISAECFSHYKAMLKDISFGISHRIKEVLWINFKAYVSASNRFATSPIMAVRACSQFLKFGFLCRGLSSIVEFVRTMTAPQMSGQSFAGLSPSLFATIYTSVPNRCATIIFAVLPYITQFWHIFSIAYLCRIFKEELKCKT